MSEWTHSNRKGPLAPNPSLWAALARGPRLRAILEALYARVYAAPRLGPFFHGVTQQRAVDKQYGFLAEIFTGERMYFGDRPRNAHHWMVISDELFDYRERLFEACVREQGLAEVHVAAWLAVHQTFRKQIVKDQPFPRRTAGVDMPLDCWARCPSARWSPGTGGAAPPIASAAPRRTRDEPEGAGEAKRSADARGRLQGLAEGRDVGREDVIRAYISANAKITRYRVKKPLLEHGIDPQQYLSDFDS